MYVSLRYLDGKTIEEAAREELNSRATELRRERDALRRFIVPTIARLEKYTTFADVRVISSYERTLTLHLENSASTLPRDIAREFEVQGVKSPDGGSLRVTFTLPTGSIVVEGYVPASCRVVETEEFVPGSVRKVRKVVCNE